MKISEKQILELLQLVQFFESETRHNTLLKSVGDNAMQLLDKIRNQQSDVIKEIE